MHILVCRYAFFLLVIGHGNAENALNSVGLHLQKVTFDVSLKWHLCKQTFLSQESNTLHQHFAHSAAGHLELQDLSAPTWEKLLAHMVVCLLHWRFLKIRSAPVSKQGAVVTFVKHELLVHFMKLKFPNLLPLWKCSNILLFLGD